MLIRLNVTSPYSTGKVAAAGGCRPAFPDHGGELTGQLEGAGNFRRGSERADSDPPFCTSRGRQLVKYDRHAVASGQWPTVEALTAQLGLDHTSAECHPVFAEFRQ